MRAVLTKITTIEDLGQEYYKQLAEFADEIKLLLTKVVVDQNLGGTEVIRYEQDEGRGKWSVIGLDQVKVDDGVVTFVVHLFGNIGFGIDFHSVSAPIDVLEFYGLKVHLPQPAQA